MCFYQIIHFTKAAKADVLLTTLLRNAESVQHLF